jgi:phosphoglycolate phosphatase-like HAD superfamily hydrolase
MIKLIIFDWDDVFTLGSKEGYIKCLHESLVSVGVHLDPHEEHRRILETWSKPHQDELKNLLRERPELLDAACESYEKNFFGGTFVESLTYVDGANELLERLNHRFKLAVATGAHPAVLREQVMPRFGVPDVFAQIISGYDIDDAEKQKPHPHMLETIMAGQSAEPTETVLVGDAKSDVQMARNAGVTPIVVLTGHLSRAEAEELGVEYITADVTQIEPILSGL